MFKALCRRREPAPRASLPSARARETALRAPLASATALFRRREPAPRASLSSALAREPAHQAPPPSHAPRSSKPGAPAHRCFQRRCSAPPPPGRAVEVGLKCGKADTETSRSRVQVDSAFPRTSDGRPFSCQGGIDKIGYLVPFPQQVCRGETFSGEHLVAIHPSPAFEGVYCVCRPSFFFTHDTPRAQCSFGYSGTEEA